MKIIWNKNPLLTSIEIDDVDIKLMKKNLIIENASETLYSVKHFLENKKYDEAVLCIKKDFYEYENLHLEKDIECYTAILKDDVHCGDCTCVPCGCMKCYAEELLETSTIDGIGKHSLYKIGNAFDNSNVTIYQAIEKLQNYNPSKGKSWEKYSEEDYQSHMPRWKNEAASAAVWLQQYKEKHNL